MQIKCINKLCLCVLKAPFVVYNYVNDFLVIAIIALAHVNYVYGYGYGYIKKKKFKFINAKTPYN